MSISGSHFFLSGTRRVPLMEQAPHVPCLFDPIESVGAVGTLNSPTSPQQELFPLTSLDDDQWLLRDIFPNTNDGFFQDDAMLSNRGNIASPIASEKSSCSNPDDMLKRWLRGDISFDHMPFEPIQAQSKTKAARTCSVVGCTTTTISKWHKNPQDKTKYRCHDCYEKVARQLRKTKTTSPQVSSN